MQLYAYIMYSTLMIIDVLCTVSVSQYASYSHILYFDIQCIQY